MIERRCGNCRFGKIIAQDLSKRVCWGAPPSAMQTTIPGGKVTIQMARPIVAVSDDACALHQWARTEAMRPLAELPEEAQQ